MALNTTIRNRSDPPRRPEIGWSVALLVFQAAAALFFLVDSIDDWRAAAADGQLTPAVLEAVVAVALLLGVLLATRNLQRLTAQANRREALLAVLRSTFSELIATRFAQWRLSAAEADVAMFALKGMAIAEIAALRGAAQGTVRSQLSQVYAKAGVRSQPMFMALFVDDLLIDTSPPLVDNDNDSQ